MKAENGHQPPRRLGDILVELGFCSREAVEEAAALALETRQLVGEPAARARGP